MATAVSTLLGRPVWYELMTTDTAAAETFYKKVVGWTSAPFDASPTPYTTFKLSGEVQVAGLMKKPEGMNMPPSWAMYVAVPKLEEAGVNVKVISAISEELFDHQSESYRSSVLPPEAVYDLMFISSGTRRMWPLRDVGPLTDEYSMTSDWDNQWLTSGLEPDVIAEAHLDAASILAGIQRFANDRDTRLSRQRDLLAKL